MQADGPPVDVLADLATLHFDLAGFTLPRALPALLNLTDTRHLLYGSDFPSRPTGPSKASRARSSKPWTRRPAPICCAATRGASFPGCANPVAHRCPARWRSGRACRKHGVDRLDTQE